MQVAKYSIIIITSFDKIVNIKFKNFMKNFFIRKNITYIFDLSLKVVYNINLVDIII